MEKLAHDVVIVGAGIAGLRAAIAAAEVSNKIGARAMLPNSLRSKKPRNRQIHGLTIQ